ncbi:unknown [Clostridium sp. CAG:729]|nr:unknown [Clostridium sp. CAG:729]
MRKGKELKEGEFYLEQVSNFKYNEFIEELLNQADNVLPDDLNVFERKYVKNAVKEYATIAAKHVTENLKISDENVALLTQIIAEWTYHKCIDLMRSTIPQAYWDAILQRINFTIYEILKKSTKLKFDDKKLLAKIEISVNTCYKECIDTLKDKSVITVEEYETAINQSNIDTLYKEKEIDWKAFLSKTFCILFFLFVCICSLNPHPSVTFAIKTFIYSFISLYMLASNEILESKFVLSVIGIFICGTVINNYFFNGNIMHYIEFTLCGFILGCILTKTYLNKVN